MDIKDLPDRRRRNYTRNYTIALPEDTAQGLDQLRSKGKDVASFIRAQIERGLSEILKKKG